MEYVQSAINYVGNKYKLLPSIIPLFPDSINVFVDLFGGGFNVGVNVDAKRIWYNDNCVKISEMLWRFKHDDTGDILESINNLIEKFELSKANKDGYIKLRKSYNKLECSYPIVLYTLMCHSFNNQFRFNSKGEFNMPFGERTFNSALKKKFIRFCQVLKKKNVQFYARGFDKFIEDFIIYLGENDFVYADPPYYNSVATYNENNGWTAGNEQKIHEYLDMLDERGVKFALSGNLKYNNPYLKEWMKKYHVHYLNADYNNCNYQKKDKSEDCEVLITNYEKER